MWKNLFDKSGYMRFLIISLLLFTTLAFFMAYLFNNTIFGNLMLNLGAEFIVIIIVIVYIDELLKKRDEEKWDDTVGIILDDIVVFNNNFITILRSFLGMSKNILDIDKTSTPDPKKINSELIKIAEHNILPKIIQDFPDISPDSWKLLYSGLKKVDKNLFEILVLFSDKIEPDFYSDLLLIRNKFRNFINFYQGFQDVIENPFLYKGSYNESEFYFLKKGYIKSLKNALELSIKLNKRLIEEENVLKASARKLEIQ